jgi:hypothetical protein
MNRFLIAAGNCVKEYCRFCGRFFSWAKHLMGFLKEFFKGIKKSRSPRKIPRNAPLYVLPETK